MRFCGPDRAILRKLLRLACLALAVTHWYFGVAAKAQETTNTTDSSALWPYEQKGALPLKNGWTVYRNQFVSPHTLAGEKCRQGVGAEPISAPDVWGPGFTTTVTSGHGFATYCREINLPESDEAFAFRMGTLRSVSHIYAVDGSQPDAPRVWLLFKNGDLSAEGTQVVANPGIPMISLPHGIRDFTLVMQLSNRIHKQGGMVEVPLLDYRWRLAASENRATAMPSALVIVLLCVGLSALVLGENKRSSAAHRYFAFLAIAAAMRAAFVSDLVWDYFPSFDLARKYDFEYLSLFVIAFAYYAFINHLLRPGRRLLIDYVIFGVMAFLIVFALFLAPFFPPGTITLTREPIQIVWAIIILMVLYAVFHATITNPETRSEAVTVALGGLGYGAYEIMSTTGVIPSSLEWSQFVIFAVMMMHARAFVIQARRTERERDTLMASLQDTNRDLQNQALALDLAVKNAEEASNAKSHFLSTFSHELRTPLNAIIGFSEMMSRELLGKLGNTIYKDYARDIHASGTHLLAMVDDLLDLSRIETGIDELKEEPLNLAALLEETLGMLRLLAEQHKVILRVDCPKNLPRFLGDERKMRQILLNLITNAIKFNVDRGSVRIVLRSDKSGMTIEIIDTGLGIAKANLPVILAQFGHADSERRRHNAGAGIGLPLSDVLVRQHGGKITITSELGEGTHVTVTFPAKRVLKSADQMAVQ
ncbi:ATP-binding protein [Kordiimonas sp.]|uniref:ATP-binding protein n=1 Tax=Kordiimonas sp. TaxID=1970157 RepID=UPI003A8F74DD